MKSNTESTSSSIELRRNERLRVGRTSDELRKYVDEFFPTVLNSEQRSDLVQIAMTTESSFTNLEQLIFELYH
jgi:hypothetical protein